MKKNVFPFNLFLTILGLTLLQCVIQSEDVKIDITDSSGRVTFIDNSTGEEVVVKVVDASTDEPLGDMYVRYVDGNGFGEFIVYDPSGTYFPSIEFHEGDSFLAMKYSNDFSYEIKMQLAGLLDYIVEFIVGSDVETIKKAISVEFGNAHCDYTDSGGAWYEETVTGDELASFRDFGRGLTLFLISPVAGQKIVSIVETIGGILDVTTEEILEYGGEKIPIRSRNWDKYMIIIPAGPVLPEGYKTVFIPSQAPQVTIDEPIVNGNNVSVSWSGTDATDYPEAEDLPSIIDATVICEGPTAGIDLTYSSRITKDGEVYNDFDWTAYSSDTSKTLNITDAGTYMFELRVKDEVGNVGTASRQFSIISWARTYGGGGIDRAYSIQQTEDGGYIVAGDTYSFGVDNFDNNLWVLKLDANGRIKWQRTYGGWKSEYAGSIQQTSDRGYIVSGYTRSFGAGDYDIWVLKLDSNGDVSWQRTYGGSGYEQLGSRDQSIQQTSDGGYIMSVYTESFCIATYCTLVLKLDAGGNTSWAMKYEKGTRFNRCIKQTTDGGYIMGLDGGCGDYDIFILKLDIIGNISWMKAYKGGDDERINSIQQTSIGDYIVTGFTKSFGAGDYDILVLKLDSNGDVSWQRTYGGSGSDFACTIQQTDDDGDGMKNDGYIVAGNTSSFGAGSADMWVLKLDGNGKILNCNIINNSNISVSPLYNFSGQNISVEIKSTSAMVTDTDILPQDTLVEMFTVCE